MRALLIDGTLKSGTIVNVLTFPDDAVIATDGASASWSASEAGGGFAAPDGHVIAASAAGEVGWPVADGAPVAPPPTVIPAVVPSSVSSAQAKIQCLRTPGAETGKTLLDDITAAVQAAGGEVAIWFADARTWDRSNAYVASLSANLKLTPAQVDHLFTAAATVAA